MSFPKLNSIWHMIIPKLIQSLSTIFQTGLRLSMAGLWHLAYKIRFEKNIHQFSLPTSYLVVYIQHYVEVELGFCWTDHKNGSILINVNHLSRNTKLYKSKYAFTFTLNNVTTSEPKLQIQHYLNLVWNPKPDVFFWIKENLTIMLSLFLFYDMFLCIKKCFPATLRGLTYKKHGFLHFGLVTYRASGLL